MHTAENVVDTIVATTGTINPPRLPSIPEGYVILDSASGDITLDVYPDMVIILKDLREDSAANIESEFVRPLCVYFGQPDGSYFLATVNNHVVLCSRCGGVFGDPYAGLSITDGSFTVSHYGGSAWRWFSHITFKYNKQEGTLYLHELVEGSFHATEPDEQEVSTKTAADFGKVRFEEYRDE